MDHFDGEPSQGTGPNRTDGRSGGGDAAQEGRLPIQDGAQEARNGLHPTLYDWFGPAKNPLVRRRTAASMQILGPAGREFDSSVISPRFYNRFSLRDIPVELRESRHVIGVTSVNRRDGKTLVACNLAVALSQGYGRRVLLVDLNVQQPVMHHIFRMSEGPGIAEAFRHDRIELSSTPFAGLYLLPVGFDRTQPEDFRNVILLREVLQSLSEYFDSIILDLSSVRPLEQFPSLLVKELDAVISVIRHGRTLKRDVRWLERQLGSARNLAFVMNRMPSET